MMEHTEETKRKISEAQKGVAHSYEHNRKVSEGLRGNQNKAKQLRLFPKSEYTNKENENGATDDDPDRACR
jgi:hypothetical protein